MNQVLRFLQMAISSYRISRIIDWSWLMLQWPRYAQSTALKFGQNKILFFSSHRFWLQEATKAQLCTNFVVHRVLISAILFPNSNLLKTFYDFSTGICCDDDGRIIIADSKNQRVLICSPMLEFLWNVEIRPSSNNILTSNMDEKDRPSDVALLNGEFDENYFI